MHNDLLTMGYLTRVGLHVSAQYGHHQGTSVKNTEKYSLSHE
jgi:hypothetical protein